MARRRARKNIELLKLNVNSKLNPLSRIAYKSACLTITARHAGRLLISGFSRAPNLVIIGESHGANAGDTAMAYAIRARAKHFGVRTQLQTLHNLEKWPDYKGVNTIVGGGTILVESQVQRLQARFAKKPEQLSILSVNFTDPKVLQSNKSFLRNVRRLTFRDRSQTAIAKAILDRDDVQYQPDPVFSLYKTDDIGQASPSCRSGGAVNILPLYQTFRDGSFETDNCFGGKRSPHWVQEERNYSRLISHIVGYHLATLNAVYHIPFAIEDWAFVKGAPALAPQLRQLCFTSVFPSLISRVARCSVFVASRFHAIVFGLITQTPLIAIPYGSKCVELLRDVGVEHPELLVPSARAVDLERAIDASQTLPALTLTDESLMEMKLQSMRPIDSVMNKCLTG